MRPMLFDLREDPNEFYDLAKGSAHNEIIDKLYLDLRNWGPSDVTARHKI